MIDLKHWDFADEFTPHEAASLILGVDPMTEDQAVRAKPILEKLRNSYHKSWRYWHTRSDGLFEFNEDGHLSIDAIESVEMRIHVELLQGKNSPDDAIEIFDRWLGHGSSEDGEFSGFFRQKFSRTELARWLMVVGLESTYKFLKNEKTTNTEIGNRERETLLSIIAVLCEEAKLDYKKPAKTAGMIRNTADRIGISIGETTIEGHLKKIPNALGSRMK